MLTAAEFRKMEITRRIEILFGQTSPKDRDYYESQFQAYTEPDYMDFAERYGDYVCDYEKLSDRLKNPVPS